MPVALDHHELCWWATRWLLRDRKHLPSGHPLLPRSYEDRAGLQTWTGGCDVASSEVPAIWGEIPDAFGFDGSSTILCEAKTSRSDFLRDREKRSRGEFALEHSHGILGNYRWYVTNPGVIKPDDWAQYPEWLKTWGHVEVKGGCAHLKHLPTRLKADRRREHQLLLRIARTIASKNEFMFGQSLVCVNTCWWHDQSPPPPITADDPRAD